MDTLNEAREQTVPAVRLVLKNGRSERIRTSDPHNPIVVRYQAALRSDFSIFRQ